MKIIEIIKRVVKDLVKGVAVALASFLGLVISGLFAGLFHLPSPTLPAYMNMTTLMPLLLISVVSIAIVLGECFQRLSWSFCGCWGWMGLMYWDGERSARCWWQ